MKGYIFDLDGVIVDTAKYHYLAWKKLAEMLGIDFTEKDNERLKGVSRKDSFDIILSLGNVEMGDDKKEEMMTLKNQWYLDYVNEMDSSEILPGVSKYLSFLRENGKKVILGSSSKNARLILGKIGLLEYFDHIVDGTLISKAKPDPEVFLMGAEMAGLKASECIVFEDAQSGIEAASNAGMKVVGVIHSSDLEGFDYSVHTFEEELIYSL